MKKRKLVIARLHTQIVTAVMEDDTAAELHISDETTEQYRVGSIYIGKVKNIVHNIAAAFIEIAPGVECYYDMTKNPSPIFTRKIGKKPLCIGDELLVQIEREAVKTKAPTVTGNLNFTGKYTVVTSGVKKIGISSKLSQEQRFAVRQAVAGLQAEDYGFIVRTNAKDVPLGIVKEELRRLTEEYRLLVRIAPSRTPFSCLREAPASFLSDIRDIYQEGLTEIITEEPLFPMVEAYLRAEQPEDLGKLTCYQDNTLPLCKLYALESVLRHALAERVWLKSGGYLVIQPTEALTVIDVNTGKCVSKKKDERGTLKLNLEAAREAARQIRLRNLSGIILIDFVNMNTQEATEELLHTLGNYLKQDPVQTVLVDITPLQLVEITRKKVRKPLCETAQTKL